MVTLRASLLGLVLSGMLSAFSFGQTLEIDNFYAGVGQSINQAAPGTYTRRTYENASLSGRLFNRGTSPVTISTVVFANGPGARYLESDKTMTFNQVVQPNNYVSIFALVRDDAWPGPVSCTITVNVTGSSPFVWNVNAPEVEVD